MLKQQPHSEKKNNKKTFFWSSCSLIASQSLTNEAWHFWRDKADVEIFSRPLIWRARTPARQLQGLAPSWTARFTGGGKKREEKWRLPVACTSFAHRLALQDWCPWPAWWTVSWLWRWWWPPLWRAPWCSPAKCKGAQLARRKDRDEIRTREKVCCLLPCSYFFFHLHPNKMQAHKEKNFFFHPKQMVISSWEMFNMNKADTKKK